MHNTFMTDYADEATESALVGVVCLVGYIGANTPQWDNIVNKL